MNTSMDEPDVSALLAPFMDVSPETLDRLHRSLVQAAEQSGDLDIAYRTIDTPVGKLLLAATETGLLRVAYDREDHNRVLAVLAAKISPRILRAPRRLDNAAREIDEYFARKRTRFDLPLDLSLSSGFRRVVQQHLPDIEYGHTESYAQIARLVGSPRAVRAVGTACATNPLPVVVPCHRVLRSDGSPGGYIGGLEAKTALLELEATP